MNKVKIRAKNIKLTLSKLDACKRMGPDKIHSQILKYLLNESFF